MPTKKQPSPKKEAKKEKNTNKDIDIDIDIEKTIDTSVDTPSPEKANTQETESTSKEEETVHPLQEKIDELEKSLADEKEKMLRNLAEMENFKKRKNQETENVRKYSIEAFAKELLPILDCLEMACTQDNTNDNNKKLLEGVQLTQKQFYTVLDKFGVSPIKTENEKFDPNIHQSIGQEANSDVEPETIIKEMQKGYMLQDRVLRPSLVIISE